MAGNSIVINVLAKVGGLTDVEKLKSKLTSLTTSSGFKSVIQGVGMGAGIAAWNMLGNAMTQAPLFLADAARAAIDEEAEIARLNTALKTNVKAWDGNMDAVEKQIDGLKRLAFSDDEMRAGLVKIVPVIRDVDKSFRVMRGAMDLARLKNISLEDASTILVKAFAGQMRGLKDLGIELKSTATNTEILAAVEEKAAGQAEAYAASHAGSIKRIGDAWGDFTEGVGGVIVGWADLVVEEMDQSEEAARHAGDHGFGYMGARMEMAGLAAVRTAGGGIWTLDTSLDDLAGSASGAAGKLGTAASKTKSLADASAKAKGPVIDFTGAIDRQTGSIGKLIDAMEAWRRKYYSIRTLYGAGAEAGGGPGPFVMPRQLGGPVYPSGSYVVGETGPELFVPRQSGTIVPNNRLGGGTPVQNTIVVQVDGRELARVLDERQYWMLQTAPVTTRAS